MGFVNRIGESRWRPGTLWAVLALGVAAPLAAAADETAGLAPVASLIEAVETEFPGRILMIELAQTGTAAGPARYDVKLLTDEGIVMRLHYDARTLTLEAVEGRGGDVARAEDEDEKELEKDDDETEREDGDDSGGRGSGDDGDDDADSSDDSGGSGSSGSGEGSDDSGSGSSGSGSSGSGSSGSGSSGSGSSGSGSSGSGGGSDDGPNHD